ncbi:MAG: dephospho-CoA kinase [Mariprofundaceae bacterium]
MIKPRVGLTGGIGAGKSTVAGMFADLGVPVFDLDAAGRRLLAEDAEMRSELVQAFGDGILDDAGGIDRRRLAEAAFASLAGYRRLNAITHPRIWAAMDRWLAGLDPGAPYALIEASALIESGGTARMDAVVVVLAPLAMRIRRAMARDGRAPGEIERIVARQVDDDVRRRVADFLIENDGDLSALRGRVDQVHRALLRRFSGGRESPARNG